MDTQNKQTFLINFAFVTVWTVIIYLIIRFTLSFLFPFVVGIILSFLVQKPATAISKKLKLDKGICAAVLVSVAFIVIIAISSFLIWILASKGMHLLSDFLSDTKTMNSFAKDIQREIDGIVSKIPNTFKGTVLKSSSGFIVKLAEKVAGFVSNIAGNIAKAFPSFLLSLAVTVVASCYIAKDFDRILKFTKNMVGETKYRKIITIKDILKDKVFKFVLGYLLLTLITFAELTVGFLILKIKYALLLAAIVAVVDLLPILGTGTVLVPWAIISMIFSDIKSGVILLVIYVIITVVRNFAEPKIIGKQIGINPLLMLITIFVGLRLSGLIGMFVLPVAVMVVINYYKQEIKNEKADTL